MRAKALIALCGTLFGVAFVVATSRVRPAAAGAGAGRQGSEGAGTELGDPTYARNPGAPTNDPPAIDDLTINPTSFVLRCQPATIVLAAHDPEGAALTFDWTIVSGPPGAALAPEGAAATFRSSTPARYRLRVTASDPAGATTSLAFAVQVLAGGDICPIALGAD
jgi:hypothetical protein